MGLNFRNNKDIKKNTTLQTKNKDKQSFETKKSFEKVKKEK